MPTFREAHIARLPGDLPGYPARVHSAALAVYHGPKVLRAMVTLRLRGIRAGRLPWMRGARPHLVTEGEVILGRGVKLDGLMARVELGAYRGGRLTVGDGVYLNSGVSAVAVDRIDIGSNTRIGEHTALLDSQLHQVEEGATVEPAPIRIGRNVWIGRHVTVMPGVEIGDHSVIGAGSVVTASVPPRTLAAGVPAQVVRALHADDAWVRR